MKQTPYSLCVDSVQNINYLPIMNSILLPVAKAEMGAPLAYSIESLCK